MSLRVFALIVTNPEALKLIFVLFKKRMWKDILNNSYIMIALWTQCVSCTFQWCIFWCYVQIFSYENTFNFLHAHVIYYICIQIKYSFNNITATKDKYYFLHKMLIDYSLILKILKYNQISSIIYFKWQICLWLRNGGNNHWMKQHADFIRQWIFSHSM